MEDKRYAVLIDSDNISSKYISSILDEMTKYGIITYKRIYGDWTSSQASKWKNELMENSITPIQQFRNTVGKNATDSTLIIDAMDILYTKNVDGFCIVSSDGDFTRLASRLKESGMDVIGMGENKTPRSFRAACTVFTDLELLLDASDDDDDVITDKTSKKTKVKKNLRKKNDIENTIIEIITSNDNKGRETDLGELGSRLQKKYTDFDVRNYGYSSLSTFIKEIKSFDIRKNNNTIVVSLKEDNSVRNDVIAFIHECIKNSGMSSAGHKGASAESIYAGIEIGALGQRIHSKFPEFKVKEYGYSTLKMFICSVKSFKIASENGRKMVILK